LITLLPLLGLLAAACTPDSNGAAGGNGKKGPSHLVELAAVTKRALQYTADRTGSLRAVREVKIFNQEEGKIIALRVREGDSFRKGELLLRLDDGILRAELDKTTASSRQAQLDLDRLQRLYEKKLVAEETLSRARTIFDIAQADTRLLRTRLGYMRITSPFDGKVAERRIEVGDVAPKHTHLLTLVDPSLLVTDVLVSELVLPYVKVGDSANVRIDALGDQIYPGRILRVYPTIDPATRRGRIEVGLQPVPPGAQPGQFTRVLLQTASNQHLAIPLASLRRDLQGEYVFVFLDGKVQRTSVRSGTRLADKVEIRDGLEAGQQVVAKGFLGLVDGQAVKPVTKTSPTRGPGDA
jgi:membrane fusion protein (multidrug efflux system)